VSSTSSVRSVGKYFLWFCLAVIVISLVAPNNEILGPISLLFGLLGIAALLVKRPVGRPASDPARRISTYSVVDGATIVPEAVLVAIAVWQLTTSVQSAAAIGQDAIVVGLVGGLLWGAVLRWGAIIFKDVIGCIVGLGALLVVVPTLTWGDSCTEGGSTVLLTAALIALGATVALGAMIVLLKKATLQKAHLSSYVLAIFGLVELMQFLIAPTGEILDDLPWWAALVLLIGLEAIALLGGVNPVLAQTLVGSMVAMAAVYLMVIDTRLSQGSAGCMSLASGLWFLLPFVGAALVLGRRQ